MRICLVSDIHMEFGSQFQKATNQLGGGGDVLIVAGDLTVARSFQPLANDASARSHQRAMEKFVKDWTTKFKRTFYVMGNHEHYGYVLPDSSKVLQAYLEGTNVKILDPGMEIIDDVLFVGSTMWTDFNDHDLDTMYAIRYSMNDYRWINRCHPDTMTWEQRQNPDVHIANGKIYPQFIAAQHERDKAYLELALAQNKDRKTVVITHHAPTLDCNGDHGSGAMMIHAYCNRFDDLIEANPQIAAWCSGHTHSNHDKMHGATRLIANCRGYEGHESIADTFAPKFFEV